MKGQLLRRGHVWQRTLQLTAATLAITGTGAVSGCLTRPLQPEDTRTTSTVVTELKESAVDKIDLVLMIDNSRSMADKQQILVEAVPDLVRGLVNPKCVDPANPTDSTKWVTPTSATDPCPVTNGVALKRDFNPVLDIHIGIVTSSIGGHGSDACPNTTLSGCNGPTNTTNNDMGHLVSRLDPCTGGAVATYLGEGFLAWDPNGKHPADPNTATHTKDLGDINIDTTTGNVTTTTPGIIPDFKDMVLGTGQIGCGYEASIESWYRFLVDPDPYLNISAATGTIVLDQVDTVLTTQRKDFLRPDSLLAIIGLTDENDCSVKEYGQFYIVNQQESANQTVFHLPKARTECATNPNDPCCRSCGQSQTGCPVDPNCGTLDDATDDVNLRCWDTKRRFGIDFLYPIDRYVTGLTSPNVPNRNGEMVANPIFTDLDPTDDDSSVRSSDLVFLAYIVGVPWQDIANDPTDLTKGFKNATALGTKDTHGKTTWDYIIGDPDNYVAPLDPHMIEAVAPRTGTDPLTGDTLSPPSMTAIGTQSMWPDKINGHEYTPGTKNGVQQHPDDLEYACIFDLPQPRDCTNMNLPACDCTDPMNDNPLCDTNGTAGRTLQTRAKGYPGIRELSLVKQLGSQGIVGSICPKQLTDLTAADFGYRPAIGAIIDRLKLALGGQCLPRALTPKSDGSVDCFVLEARNTNGAHKADCDAFCDGKTSEMLTARSHVQGDESSDTNNHKAAVAAALADPSAKGQNWDCFCEITPLLAPGDAGASPPGCNDSTVPASPLEACQCNSADPPVYNGSPVNGWCYVDQTSNPPLGNPNLVQNCQPNEKHLVRFVGTGHAAEGATLFTSCSGD